MGNSSDSSKKSQWNCIRENIGTWEGAFTQFSPEGEQVKETPSVLTLTESDSGEEMSLKLERTSPGEATNVVTRSFSAPGPAPYILFFESGAFSQGSAQWASFGQFGAEASLKAGDRRVRFVIMYDGTSESTSQLKYVTLIRETQPDGTRFSEPAMTLDQLSDRWSGSAEFRYATMDPMQRGTSQWQWDDGFHCEEAAAADKVRALSLTSRSDSPLPDSQGFLTGENELDYQLMPLPNGTYVLLPYRIRGGCAFRIEVGWLRSDRVRSRLIRYYDERGVWMSTAVIEDRLQ